jgi:hypothetical protein
MNIKRGAVQNDCTSPPGNLFKWISLENSLARYPEANRAGQSL